MTFRCHGCGACCMSMDLIRDVDVDKMAVPETIKQSIRDFPYEIDSKGWCEKLGAYFKCTVYEDRPLFCRVDNYYNEMKEKPPIEQYYADTENMCKELMEDKLGMSKEQIKKVYDDI
jgi:Fe-S-cluster containining protein